MRGADCGRWAERGGRAEAGPVRGVACADGISRTGFDDPFVSMLSASQSVVDWSPLWWPREHEELFNRVFE